MIDIRLTLRHAERRLVARLGQLEQRLDAGDETAWSDYLATLTTTVAVVRELAPETSGALLTTAQLAERLQLSEKTILRRAKAGQLQPVRMGERGRGALRWRA